MGSDAVTFAEETAELAAGRVRFHVGGSGRPVIYLHSAGGVRLSPAIRQLARRFRFYAPVFPGFDGTAPLPGVEGMRDLAELVADFARRVVGGRADVMGHSFGGQAAAWLAVLHPDRVDQLVLQAAAGFRAGPPPAGDPKSLLYAHPERLSPQEEEAVARAQANRPVAQRYRAGGGIDEALVARLGEVTALSLILHGTQDRMVGAEASRLIKSRIRRSHLLYVYDAGHVIEVDQPQRFARLVGDFLGRGEGFLVNWGQDAATAAD